MMPPTVSVIVPCYNERTTIASLLNAVFAQTYPRERMEVVIADGLSEDGTREEIERFRKGHPALAIKVVDNNKRTIPAGLNTAIRAVSGEILIRLDAHSMPIPEYVQRCVQALEGGKGSNVGGIWLIEPGGPGWVAKGIAAAAAHPLGAGDAFYRLGGAARAVDTVPFGAFRRDLLKDIGDFDETLLTNEDYEFNVRVRRHGGIVWMDPQIQTTYLARPTLTELGRQYWRYGYWKWQMLRRYPGTIRWRQALPPLFVLSLLIGAAASLIWKGAAIALLYGVGIYVLALLGAGLQMAASRGDLSLVASSMLALATMHFSWGCGFLASMAGAGATRHG